MGKVTHDYVSAGLRAFREGVTALMEIRGIESDSELARMVKRRDVGGPSKKTVNNALAGRHDAQISTLQAIADALDCPLWVLFLLGQRQDDLRSPARERLIAMVSAYLECDDESRHHVESMAAAFAAKSRK